VTETPPTSEDSKLSSIVTGIFRTPTLTRRRIIAALIVAVVADGLQFPCQAVPVAPEIIDVVAMVLTCWVIGFHVLLLPTFIVELIPIADMLPTWTGCVIAVIALRKRGQRNEPIKDATPVSKQIEGPDPKQ
jgi:hypothetical protein